MSRRIRLNGEGRLWTMDIGEADVRIEGVERPYTVTGTGDERIEVSDGAGTESGVAAIDGDTIWVTLGIDVFEFQVVHGRGGSAARDHDALRPPMSATVTRVAVKVGDEVKTGDVLIALEAMKMELPIRAPHDGVIKAVMCREGDLVQPGQELIDM